MGLRATGDVMMAEAGVRAWEGETAIALTARLGISGLEIQETETGALLPRRQKRD